MKSFLHFLIILSLISPEGLNAQTDVTIRKKDFKNNNNGFNEAWKHVEAGDAYYSKKGIFYGKAYDEYLKALGYNSIHPELNYKTGVSALLGDNKEKAADYFLKAIQMRSDVAPDILLLTGRALQYAGKYSEAIEKFDGYLNAPVKKSDENINAAKKYSGECRSAIDLTNDTLRIEVSNAGSNINSDADDYSEVLSADGKTMFFASRREMPKSGSPGKDSKFDENIFFLTIVNGNWSSPSNLGKKLTTRYCEAPLYLTPDDEYLYVYSGYQSNGNIMVSRKKNGNWKALSPVSFKINSKGSETSMTISPSGNEVWFVSDRGKKGLGGKDIYFIKKLSTNKWTRPENAGPKINTPEDEESVRFSKSGDTLWFSSRGHNTIGGFDIFFSTKDSIGQWSEARNYGFPVNTPWDELFYCPLPYNDSSFYFVSNRPESIGGLDVFLGRILPAKPVQIPVAPPKPDTVIIRDTVVIIREITKAPPQPAAAPVVVPVPTRELILYLIGKITDSETGAPVIAKVDVIDPSTNLTVATTASSDLDGRYRIKLPERKSYLADFRANGFLSDMKKINIAGNDTSEVHTLNIPLVKVKVGRKVVLNNIHFETGKSVLTLYSSAEVNRLFGILQDNPLMRIEISGHTDNTGSEPLNFKLSESRAKAVVDYLVQKGISSSRLEYKGFGSLQPVADNATAAGRTKNRRVEFKILEF